MEPVTFGNPDAQNFQEKAPEGSSAQNASIGKKTSDVFDSATGKLQADQATSLARFLKRFIPVVIFIFTCVFGVGLGRTALVSNCIQGVYGEISLFFGAVSIPLYILPDACHLPDKAQDYMSIRPFVFVISFIVVFAIWSYFDRKLEWRDRGNYQTF